MTAYITFEQSFKISKLSLKNNKDRKKIILIIKTKTHMYEIRKYIRLIQRKKKNTFSVAKFKTSCTIQTPRKKLHLI